MDQVIVLAAGYYNRSMDNKVAFVNVGEVLRLLTTQDDGYWCERKDGIVVFIETENGTVSG